MSITTFQPRSFDEPTLTRCLQIQVSVIWALFYKEFRGRIGRNRLGPVIMLVRPIGIVSVISFGWYLAGRTTMLGIPIVLFAATGYVPFLWARGYLSRVPGAIGGNMNLYDYRQVKPIDALIASSMVESMVSLVAMVLISFFIFWFWGHELKVQSPAELVLLLITASFFMTGFALAVGVYAVFYDSVHHLMKLSRRVMMLVSSVLIPISELPQSAQKIVIWNPLLQIIELIRIYIFGLEQVPGVSFSYVLICALISVFTGVTVYYANRHKLLLMR